MQPERLETDCRPMLPLELAKSLIDFVRGLLLAVPVLFHQQADEHLGSTVDAIEISVGKLAPPTFDQGSHLIPTTAEYILHFVSPSFHVIFECGTTTTIHPKYTALPGGIESPE